MSIITCIPFLTDKECQEVIESSGNWVKGTVSKFGQMLTNKDLRSVSVSSIDISKSLSDRIFDAVYQCNINCYRYHIEAYESTPKVFKYSSDTNDHYVWHSDYMPGSTVRKLSISLQLSNPDDYEGGLLEFIPKVDNKKQLDRGVLIIFPSYMTHRITPVTKGIRYSLVGWIYGPEFR